MNTIAETFEKNSGNIHYNEHFLQSKIQAEKINIDINQDDDNPLNVILTHRELDFTLSSLKINKTAEPDEVSYEFLTHLGQ